MAEDSAMSVPVCIIVQSTQDVSGNISEDERRARVDQVIAFMANLFGGATTSAPERGAYVDGKGTLIIEEVQSVKSFCTTEQWKRNCKVVRAKVVELCREWGQECMGLIFCDVMEHVYAEEQSAEMLWTSLVPRLNQRARH